MAGDRGGLGPDLYEVLGVPREASGEEVTRAWRRRARAEHPDAHPAAAGAAARFHAVAQAYQVLGHPGRRAAYDEGLEFGQFQPSAPARPVKITVRRWPGEPAAPPVVVPVPPLRAGPVWVDPSGTAVPAGERARLAALAELVSWWLASREEP
jgi:curved DNA-binding protein CbpA